MADEEAVRETYRWLDRFQKQVIDPNTDLDRLFSETSDELMQMSKHAAVRASAVLLHRPAGSTNEPEWVKSLTVLSKSDDRTNGEIFRAIAKVTACWGFEKIRHYHWDTIGRPTAVALAAVAERFPSWPHAAERMNAAMLDRHIVALQSRKSNLAHGGFIGTWLASASGPSQPIQRKDLDQVLAWAKDNKVLVRREPIQDTADGVVSSLLQEEFEAWSSCETVPPEVSVSANPRRISSWPLRLDEHALLVPRIPQPAREKRPSANKSKRKGARASSPSSKKARRGRKASVDNTDDGPQATSASSTPSSNQGNSIDSSSEDELSPEGSETNSQHQDQSWPGTSERQTTSVRSVADSLRTPMANSTADSPHANDGYHSSRPTIAGKSLDCRAKTSGKVPRLRLPGAQSQVPPSPSLFVPEHGGEHMSDEHLWGSDDDAPGTEVTDEEDNVPQAGGVSHQEATVSMGMTPRDNESRSTDANHSPEADLRMTQDLNPTSTNSHDITMRTSQSELPSVVPRPETQDQEVVRQSSTMSLDQDPVDQSEEALQGCATGEHAELRPATEVQRLFTEDCPACQGDCQAKCEIPEAEQRTNTLHFRILQARKRISDSGAACFGLTSWTSPIRLARTYYGSKENTGCHEEDADVVSLTYDTLTTYLRTRPLLHKPTIITGPFGDCNTASPNPRPGVRLFDGACIDCNGTSWLRSIYGGHLCLIIPEAHSGDRSPERYALATFLSQSDILLLPKRNQLAVVNLDTGSAVASSSDEATGETPLGLVESILRNNRG